MKQVPWDARKYPTQREMHSFRSNWKFPRYQADRTSVHQRVVFTIRAAVSVARSLGSDRREGLAA
jgi:hypothetical protein